MFKRKKKDEYQSTLLREQDEALKALNQARENYNNSDLQHIGIAIKQLSAAEQNYNACLEKIRLDMGISV